jgi:hypothetical protein
MHDDEELDTTCLEIWFRISFSIVIFGLTAATLYAIGIGFQEIYRLIFGNESITIYSYHILTNIIYGLMMIASVAVVLIVIAVIISPFYFIVVLASYAINKESGKHWKDPLSCTPCLSGDLENNSENIKLITYGCHTPDIDINAQHFPSE